MRTAGLALEQAPPLSVPASFFCLAPLALAGAGVLLLEQGATPFLSPWLPAALSLTHLGTVALLASVMLGALYQMCPVVAGAPIPAVRLAWLVAALWGLGSAALVLGFRFGHTELLRAAISLLGLGLALFVFPVAWALLRKGGPGPTVAGMRLALLALFVAAFLGLWMAHGHAGWRFPGPRALWLRAHLGVGLFGWVGGLLAAVSWQVVPMFYLSAPVIAAARWLTLALLALGGLGAPIALLFGLPLAPFLVLGVLGAWLLHPVLTLAALSQRRRRAPDPSARAWQLAMICGLLCAALAAPAWLALDARYALLLGWTAIAGWAGLTVHGMLTRILPFLVWFHRHSAQVGLASTPSLRSLLPVETSRLGLRLHAAALPLGALAIWTGWDLAAQATGLLLLLTGLWMGRWQFQLLRGPRSPS